MSEITTIESTDAPLISRRALRFRREQWVRRSYSALSHELNGPTPSLRNAEPTL